MTFAGGIIHVIDSPLIPPQDIVPTTSQYRLTGLQGALFTAKQVDAVTAAKGVTLFAPSNEAFQKLGTAVSELTVEQLSSVLAYHLISNQTIYSTSLLNGSTLTTSSGKKLTILEFGNKMFVNTAQVTEKDILLKNGVLHTIDGVLNPDDDGDTPDPEVATQKAVWAKATSVESVPFTSAIPCSTACIQTGGPGATGSAGGTGSTLKTTSSKAAASPMETGFSNKVMGVAAAVVGGAVMIM